MNIEEYINEFYRSIEAEGAVVLTGATAGELHYMMNKKFRVRKKYQNRVLRRNSA